MMFCPKCKSLMHPKDGKFVCKRCGHEKKSNDKETKVVKIRRENKEIALLEDSKIDILPKIRIECARCGNKEAYWILRQMRGSDEPETRFFTCTKCSYKWRE